MKQIPQYIAMVTFKNIPNYTYMYKDTNTNFDATGRIRMPFLSLKFFLSYIHILTIYRLARVLAGLYLV